MEVQKRFEKFFQKTTDGSCWFWRGYIRKDGYAQFKIKYKMVLAHRVSYELYIGKIPEGLLVCHTCDVRHCVNPNHFFIGTYSDNINDMVKKGRRVKGDNSGERNGKVKFTKELVLEIRELYAKGEKVCDLARKYGLLPRTINGLVHKKTWRHI